MGNLGSNLIPHSLTSSLAQIHQQAQAQQAQQAQEQQSQWIKGVPNWVLLAGAAWFLFFRK